MSRPSLQALGDASFARSEHVSAELLALTYGSFVRQLVQDYESPSDVNAQLEAIGYNMGVRLVEDFLAKSNISHCSSLAETAEVIAKVAFKMFLGVSATVGVWSQDKKTFGIVFDDNPLAEFAELPEECGGLWYSNVLCGVIRGALEMVNMKVECRFERCRLRGDECNEIRVSLHEILVEQVSRARECLEKVLIVLLVGEGLTSVACFECFSLCLLRFASDSRPKEKTRRTGQGRVCTAVGEDSYASKYSSVRNVPNQLHSKLNFEFKSSKANPT